MITRSKLVCSLLLLALTGLTYGCGGGSSATTASVDTTSVRSGSVVQGPVSGSTVFADNVASGVGTRFFLDTGSEVVAALSDSTGKYLLPTFPSYDFILVSYGGKDETTLNKEEQILLMAPAGASNITPLTTLVTLDTNKQVQAKVEALMGGVAYDTRVDTGATPAGLLLVKTIETAVRSLSAAVQGVAISGSFTIDRKQTNYIQAMALQKIALACGAAQVDDLATPAKLQILINSAMDAAITAIAGDAQNSNLNRVTLAANKVAFAANIAATAVSSAANALSVVDLNTPLSKLRTDVKSEISLLQFQTIFSTAVTSAAGAPSALAAVAVTSSTPSTFSPAPINVVTTTNAAIIKILTGATGGSGTGIGVTF